MIWRVTIIALMASLLISQPAAGVAMSDGVAGLSTAALTGEMTVYAKDVHDCCPTTAVAACSAAACSVGQCTSTVAVGDYTPIRAATAAAVRVMNVEAHFSAHTRLPWRPPIAS